MFKELHISDEAPVPSEITSSEVLAAFVAKSMGLIPKKGRGDISIKMLQIFASIAGKREESVKVGGREVKIKNGAVKIEDLHHWLQSEGISVGLSQLYTTYLSRFVASGLVVKRKHSMYGLRADRLEDAVLEVKRDLDSVFGKIAEHAKRLDNALRGEK